MTEEKNIKNEEVVDNEERFDEIKETEPEKKFGILSAAAIVGAGYLIFKKGIKPMIEKHKAKKKLNVANSEGVIDIVENETEADADE